MKKDIIIGSILLAGLIFIWFYIKNLNSQLLHSKQISADLSMKADLELGRANTYFSDMNKWKKQLDEHIQEDIKNKGATVISVGEAEAHYTVTKVGTLEQTAPVVWKLPEKPGTTPILQSAPFSYQDFRLHVTGDAGEKKSFVYSLVQRFEILIAETKLPSGGINNYAELYELDQDGHRIGKLGLTKFDVHHAALDPKKFHLCDPYVDILAGGVIFSGWQFAGTGSLGLSVMSFGRNRDLDWRFIRFGVGVDQKGLELSLSPIQYNFAQPLPIINNLWLSPSLIYNMDNKTYGIGLGIAATL